MWPIQLIFLRYITCTMFLSFLTLCDTSSCLAISPTHFSFCSIKFQNFSSISDQLYELSKFQHHAKLCSTFCILLVSSFNLSPICWCKVFFLFHCCFCPDTPGFKLGFMCHIKFVCAVRCGRYGIWVLTAVCLRMWPYVVGWVVFDVSNDRNAFIFRDKQLYPRRWRPLFSSKIANTSPNDTTSHSRRPEPQDTEVVKQCIWERVGLFHVTQVLYFRSLVSKW
jgi:hypothetical protein